MKNSITMAIVVAVFCLAVPLGISSFAFHSGGVAECIGCHSMHGPAAGGSMLLVATDPSSTCLSCHEHAGDTGPSSYHVSTSLGDMPAGMPPKQRTPGGDFGWLKKSYTFVVENSEVTEQGESHGHNIVANDFGYVVDSTHTTAPGGTLPSSQLACNSCHDPHGKYRRLSTGAIVKTGAPIIASGSYATSTTPGYAEPPAAGTALGVYRLLAGYGYSNKASGTIGFPGVPAAKAPNTYNQTEATNQVRVAYGVKYAYGQHATWSSWCATCHPRMHSTGNYVHTVDAAVGSTIIGRYNAYVRSGISTGSSASSFLSVVPFLENTGDYTRLASHASNTGSYLNGPTDGDQVACPSCHRAHASGFPKMMRWQMDAEFTTYVDGGGNAVWPGTDTTPATPQYARGRTSAETQAAYYDRPATMFDAYQRKLCNKCHVKD